AVELLFFPFVGPRRSTPALPDDGVVDRAVGRAIPNDGRFALIGDPDGCDVLGFDVCLRKRLTSAVELGVPDVFGIVFDPSGTRKNLGKLLLAGAHDASRTVKQYRARRCRALIESQYVVGHLLIHLDELDLQTENVSYQRCYFSFSTLLCQFIKAIF